LHRRIVTWGIAAVGVAALSGLAVAGANTVSTTPPPASVSHRPRANAPAGSTAPASSTSGATTVNNHGGTTGRDGTPTAPTIDNRGRDSTTATSVDDHGGSPSTATTVDHSGPGGTPEVSTSVATTTPDSGKGRRSDDPFTTDSGGGRR
jgi:hypothetical protein